MVCFCFFLCVKSVSISIGGFKCKCNLIGVVAGCFFVYDLVDILLCFGYLDIIVRISVGK